MTGPVVTVMDIPLIPGVVLQAGNLNRLHAEEGATCERDAAPEEVGDPELWLYRDRTIGMLRRYFQMSIEVGRLPSLLGREFFRTRVTSYTVSTFEDSVIFVHDVERILAKLDSFDKKIIGRIVLQNDTQDEAARILNCARRTVSRRFPEAVDRITESFLEGGLLTRLPVPIEPPPESCQGGQKDENDVCDCKQGE